MEVVGEDVGGDGGQLTAGAALFHHDGKCHLGVIVRGECHEYTVGGVTYRYLQVLVGYKSMIYNLTYTALPQNFEANRADVEAIISAFSFR